MNKGARLTKPTAILDINQNLQAAATNKGNGREVWRFTGDPSEISGKILKIKYLTKEINSCFNVLHSINFYIFFQKIFLNYLRYLVPEVKCYIIYWASSILCIGIVSVLLKRDNSDNRLSREHKYLSLERVLFYYKANPES